MTTIIRPDKYLGVWYKTPTPIGFRDGGRVLFYPGRPRLGRVLKLVLRVTPTGLRVLSEE